MLQLLDGLFARSGFEHAVAIRKRPPQATPHGGVIVHHQNRHFWLRLVSHTLPG
jgi:hypothetical protein